MEHIQTGSSVSIAYCSRCSAPCKIASDHNPDARLLRHSTTTSGFCANCAATAFIKSLDVFMISIEQLGVERALSFQPFRDGFADLLKAGKADASPEELNWDMIIKHWDLPLPKPARRKRAK